MCIHDCIHTFIHACLDMRIPTYIDAYMHSFIHVYAYVYILTYMYACMLSYMHAFLKSCIHHESSLCKFFCFLDYFLLYLPILIFDLKIPLEIEKAGISIIKKPSASEKVRPSLGKNEP